MCSRNQLCSFLLPDAQIGMESSAPYSFKANDDPFSLFINEEKK
jgi:hypothetical protein